MAAPIQSVFGYILLPPGSAYRTLNGVKVVRVWYNYKNVGFKHESPMGLEVGLLASAGRGFSPPTCMYCIVIVLYYSGLDCSHNGSFFA